jgi:hypothetical protein
MPLVVYIHNGHLPELSYAFFRQVICLTTILTTVATN